MPEGTPRKGQLRHEGKKSRRLFWAGFRSLGTESMSEQFGLTRRERDGRNGHMELNDYLSK